MRLLYSNRYVRPMAALGLVLGFGLTPATQAAILNVSKDAGRAPYQTIQSAVDKAKNGDEIVILDNANYPEQVTIDSTKSGLILRSANPTALKKPTIIWNDKVNVGPKTCQEALVDKNITFDQNGALRLLRTRNIIIEGIAVDGGGRSPFGYPGVWGNGVDCNGNPAPLNHGNAAIDLFVSGDVTIRDCDITNSYFGINVKDRNEGGVFANPNPADLDKWRVVPLSGFGKTGNHVIERNRIHNNSYGIFFESAWDMASTIRYNLIYSNYQTPSVLQVVKTLPEPNNQPGGSILFKDVVLSPIAIYNNTFWDNSLLFVGHWKPGATPLVFNNIIGKPNQYWGTVSGLATHMEMEKAYLNRSFNSLYAAQHESPKLDSQKVQAQLYDTTLKAQVIKDSVVKFYRNVRIMNDMGNPVQSNFTVNLTLNMSSGPITRTETIQGAVLPGAIIDGTAQTTAFPPSANVRWLEVPFLSTDPTSPDFLTPDWEDSLVTKYVVDQGWASAGLKDADGSPADIGAIPFGGVPKSDLFIKPLSPVIINGTTGTFTFNIQEIAGDILNPTITYFRWMNDIPITDYTVTGKDFGNATKALPPTTTLTPTGTVNVAGTTITATVPARTNAQLYGFAEIIISGTDSKGNKVTTNVGFLPFRKLDYKFVVEVWDIEQTQKLTTVPVGQPVLLVVTPQKSDGQAFTNTVIPVDVALSSGADLVIPGANPTKLTYPQGITNKVASQVMFTKVPAGGIEIIRVSGIWTSGGQDLAFLGTSTGIRITPGKPVKVLFQDPPSKVATPGTSATIDPGQTYTVKLSVYDAFGNKTAIPGTVAIKSNNTAIGDIIGPKTATSDTTGTVTFQTQVTGGDAGQLYELEASLTGGDIDKADMKVGKPRDQLWIFYSDAATGFNPTVELRGTAGDRLPVTIRASKDGIVKVTERTNAFTVQLSAGLTAYDDLTSTTPKTQFSLVAGEVIIYVTGSRTINDGDITLTPVDDITLVGGKRGKIFFTTSSFSIKSADYSASNGIGAVDRLDIVFGQDLTKAPDSLYLSWPTVGANSQVVRTGITLDPANPKHVIVTLSTPFPAGITTGGGALGSAFIIDPKAPEEPAQKLALNIADNVGPLIDSGRVYEKIISTGSDTLLLSFSEPLSSATLLGASLQLLKSGQAPIVMNVTGAQDLGGAVRFKIVVADLGAQSPVAGDSVRILPAGPVTDALGNLSNPLNRPVALGLKTVPRPPVLLPDFDQPWETINIPTNLPDFLVLSPKGDQNWSPVFGGQGNRFGDCAAGTYCGTDIANLPSEGKTIGKIDRPAVNIVTDRGFKFVVRIFTNTGIYLNSFEGEITNDQLGLDARGTTNGSPTKFNRLNGNFVVKIAWNPKTKDGQKIGTGAYIFRYTVVANRELEDGTFVQEQRRQDLRFGIVRGLNY